MNTSQNTLGFNQVRNDTFDDFMDCASYALSDYKEKFLVSKMPPRGYGKLVYNQWTLNSVAARRFLGKYGYKPGNSYTQRIPECVFRGSPAFVKAFLQSLLEADGSILGKGKTHQIVFDSVSDTLLNEVSLLLRMYFGIFASKISTMGGHRLSISGADNLARFKEYIGFRSEDKQSRLRVDQSALNGTSIGGGVRDCIPFSRELGLNNYESIRRPTFRNKFKLGEITSASAKLLFERDYYYERVISVTDAGEAQVWDLTVPGTHSFVADGFVVHNTNITLSNYGWTMFEPDYINKVVTSFVPNYDDTTHEPVSLPTLLPNVLLNGGEGIGVGSGATTCLPTFTPESLIDIMLRILRGEKPTAVDFAKTLKYANVYGGKLVNTPANKTAWLNLFKGSQSAVLFESTLVIDRDLKTIEIDDWPTGLNPTKFITKIKSWPEVARAYNHSGATGFRIEMRKDHNFAQFDSLIAKVQKATHTRRHFKINVTHRRSEVNDGVVSFDTKYLSLSVPQLLVAWLRERMALEKRSLAYRVDNQQRMIDYSNLLIFASTKIDVIIKIVRNSETPKEDLMTTLKLSELQAEQILDLQLRNVSRLDQGKIKAKLSEQEQLMKQLLLWTKKPRDKVIQDTARVMEAINKDRKFEENKNRKMTVS